MKKASALWGGTALLIELVILILALVRGDWMIPLLLAVFAGWSLWLIFTQLLPVWKNNRAYRKKEQELREQPVDGSNNLESDGELSKMLLQHVNYRILTILKAAYPNVQWEWTMEDPAAFVTRGGTGRIRLYEVPDYDFADVTLDRRANLRCDLVKVVPAVPDGSPASASGQPVVDPGVWYELRGRKVLDALIPDLQSRGYDSLMVMENGEICIDHEKDGKAELLDTLLDFPAKVYWPQLVKVLPSHSPCPRPLNINDIKIRRNSYERAEKYDGGRSEAFRTAPDDRDGRRR